MNEDLRENDGYKYVVQPDHVHSGVWSVTRMNCIGQGWHIRNYTSETAAHHVAYLLLEAEKYGANV